MGVWHIKILLRNSLYGDAEAAFAIQIIGTDRYNKNE